MAATRNSTVLNHLTRRTLCMALAATALAPRRAAAHALPGTTITLTIHADNISLDLSLPLDELALAMAEPLTLPPGPVPTALTGAFATYFAAHMALTLADDPAPLSLRPESLTITTATHDHVGTYLLLNARFTAPVARPLPLTLHYDAVLHQVRNHRAVVLVASAGRPPVAMGEIRANPDGGQARPFVLAALP